MAAPTPQGPTPRTALLLAAVVAGLVLLAVALFLVFAAGSAERMPHAPGPLYSTPSGEPPAHALS